MPAFLSVRDLTVAFDTPSGPQCVVDGVSFDIGSGESVALVGESGSGKTVTALAILGLLPPNGKVTHGGILLGEFDLVKLRQGQLQRLRGSRISLMLQDPAASLNPVFSIGHQVESCVRLNRGGTRMEARRMSEMLLDQVGLPDPVSIARAYPHELSGGMQQRAALAVALGGAPELLIADEPTSALDVTVQSQIVALLRDIRQARSMALLLITHDFGLVNALADRVVVIYAGRVVEEGTRDELLTRARHPYTRALLASLPQRALPRGRLQAIPGAVPNPRQWGPGCRFVPRCPLAMAQCHDITPPPLRLTLTHRVDCHAVSSEIEGTDE